MKNFKVALVRYESLRQFMKAVSETKDKEWISTKVFTLILDSCEGKKI